MIKEFFEISLTDLRFFARHGVFTQERIVGNEFSVDLSIKTAVSENFNDNSLETTISYAELYEIVKKEMKLPRNLIETVAKSIGEEILKKYSDIWECKIKVTKLSPPLSGMSGKASVIYNYHRNS